MLSRAESQHSHFSRRRSNTAQSALRTLPTPLPSPLKIGDSKIFNLWVHEVRDASGVLFNHSLWPGAAGGDLMKVSKIGSENSDETFLFFVPKEDQSPRAQLQLSVPKSIADAFNLRNNGEVIVTKVDEEACNASHVELIFQDQYLGRNDMWRLGEQLVGECVFLNQLVSFVGVTVAKIQNIYIKGKRVCAQASVGGKV